MANMSFPPEVVTNDLPNNSTFVADMITAITNAVHSGEAPASDVITTEIGSGSLELAQAEW